LASASSNKSSSGLTSGTKIAIGVSVGAGILILIAAIVGVCFVLRRRRKKQAALPTLTEFEKAELDGTHTQSGVEPTIKDKSAVQELDAQDQIQELEHHERTMEPSSPVELPANRDDDTP
jgi:flagellar biosynthesis/type III secretory pathway M-ring protein FliF/YscJ